MAWAWWGIMFWRKTTSAWLCCCCGLGAALLAAGCGGVLAGLGVGLLPQPASSPPAVAAATSTPATLWISIGDRSPSEVPCCVHVAESSHKQGTVIAQMGRSGVSWLYIRA